ncbi:MAG: phosphotransferase [Planctomycetota bacterium]
MFNRINPLTARAGKPTTTIGVSAAADRWVQMLLEQRLAAEARGRQVGRTSDAELDGLLDVRLAGPGEPKEAEDAFERLRWGGVFACIDPDPARIERLMKEYDGANGFSIEQPMDELWGGPMGLRIPGVTPRAFFFVARKTHLAQPGTVSERHTYDVTLVPDAEAPHGYRVRKQVPTVEDTVQRLLRRSPGLARDEAQLKALRLINEVFPIFLTREAKMLQAVQAALPESCRQRVPRLLGVGKNEQGFVTALEMNWLRNGGRPISHLEYARQAAELLTVLHDHARIMHLDLRSDNLVITEHGVGFIDFGTAAHVDEDLLASKVLGPLFSDVMKASQIQKSLGLMLEQGKVTNEALAEVYGRPDRKVDTFQLAVLINQPHANPEFERLVEYNPIGATAQQLETLTAAILRPQNPDAAAFKAAADVLRGIKRIASRAE